MFRVPYMKFCQSKKWLRKGLLFKCWKDWYIYMHIKLHTRILNVSLILKFIFTSISSPGANILRDNAGNVKLTDFGISHQISSMSSTYMNIGGTLPYMAPELLDGKKATTKVDIWLDDKTCA